MNASSLPPIVHCSVMDEVRAQIDALDRRIVPLIAERSFYVAQAGRIKADPALIVDRERIEAIAGSPEIKQHDFTFK